MRVSFMTSKKATKRAHLLTIMAACTKYFKANSTRQNTINNLNTKLGDKKSLGNGTASCLDPHYEFVYLLNSKPIA